MNYIDGFVTPVPVSKRAAFITHAKEMAAVMKEYGALQVTDCWGDDVPEGKLTSFTMAVQRKDDEVAVFSWITWPSKAVRDEGWKKMMADPRITNMGEPPFDGKRLIYGGFEVVSQV